MNGAGVNSIWELRDITCQLLYGISQCYLPFKIIFTSVLW